MGLHSLNLWCSRVNCIYTHTYIYVITICVYVYVQHAVTPPVRVLQHREVVPTSIFVPPFSDGETWLLVFTYRLHFHPLIHSQSHLSSFGPSPVGQLPCSVTYLSWPQIHRMEGRKTPKRILLTNVFPYFI